MIPLIILDRDGVINQDSPHFIKTPEEWIPIPGSLEAITQLNRAGFKVAIATNQSGIGRGLYSLKTLDEIHQKMQDTLATLGGHIDLICFCPHHPEKECECRKPKAGLMFQIAEHFNIHLSQNNTFAIGDSLRDLQASNAAGCHSILVLTGNGKHTLNSLPAELKDTPIYPDLAHAVEALLFPNSK